MTKLLLVDVKYGDFEGAELLVELDRLNNDWIKKYELFVEADEHDALVEDLMKLEESIRNQEKVIQDYAIENAEFRATLKAFKYFDDLEGVKNNLSWMDVPKNNISERIV